MQNNNRQFNQLCSIVLILTLFVTTPLSVLAQKSKKSAPVVSKLTEQQKVLHLLDRITFGARPGEVERINQIGWEKYLEEQMQPEKIGDELVAQKLQSLATLKMTDEQIAKTYDPPQDVIKQLRDRFQPKITAPENSSEPATNDEMKAEKPKPVNDADFMSDPKKRREYAKALMDLGYRPRQEVVNELQTRDLSAFDAVLSVSPYYNKPTQEGIYQHFRAVAEASPIPVILYNVPGRTSSNMLPATVVRLANGCKNIVQCQILPITEFSGISFITW